MRCQDGFLARARSSTQSESLSVKSRFCPLTSETYSLGVGRFDRGDDRGHRVDEHGGWSSDHFRI